MRSDPFEDPFKLGPGPSVKDIFKKYRGGGGHRAPLKPEEAAGAADSEPAETVAEESPAPEEKKDKVLLKNPKWDSEEVGFNEKTGISVEAEMPPEHAHKTKVAFELFAKTPSGPEAISKAEGQAKNGKATVRIPVYIPQYKDEGGNLLARVEYYFTAKHSESDLLKDETAAKVVDHLADKLIEVHVLQDITFTTGKSFPSPGQAAALKTLGDTVKAWRDKHPEGKLAIFGHADAVGQESANKSLSERRARSLHAFLAKEPKAWEDLYGEEKWGLATTQELLKHLGHDPGPIDGQDGPKTQGAVKAFQGAKGLTQSGAVDSNTRAALYTAYLEDCASPAAMAKEFDAIDGKPYVGCSEFNLVEKTEGTAEVNRRVAVLLLKSNKNFPIQYPCKQGDIGSCQMQAGRKGERRNAGFQCLFYDQLVKEEGKVQQPGQASPRRIRLAGNFFDTDKCFPLPIAIPGLRRMVEIHKEQPEAKILIVGHTDSTGKEDADLILSLDRAQAMKEYLKGDAGAWAGYFEDSDPTKRWGIREIQLMLHRLRDEGGFPFLVGSVDGKSTHVTEEAVRAFQKAKYLAVDGIPGPVTRKVLIESYMDLIGISLPEDAEILIHGCGGNFPAAQLQDAAKSPQDLRTEIFIFDHAIRPMPSGLTSKAGSTEYPKWVADVSETVELLFSDPAGTFAFDLPKQKEQVIEPESFPGGSEKPILVAANDDAVVAGIIAEARDQHEKRGKDNTISSGFGVFIPFKMVEKIVRPEIKFDHGFLDDGDGNLDFSKKKAPEASDFIAYMKWDAKLTAAEALLPELSDATRAYRNFLTGLGLPMVFDYEKYVRDDRAGKILVESAIEDAMAAALEFSDRTAKAEFKMQTAGVAIGPGNSRYPYPGTENWQKAIGAHVIWLEADVKVKVKVKEKMRHFEIFLIVRAEDRYNFNPGEHDIATGIPDSENGRFEITGLGREFDSMATLKRKITFETGLDPVPDFRIPPDGKQVSIPR